MNPPHPHTAWLYITLTCWPPNPVVISVWWLVVCELWLWEGVPMQRLLSGRSTAEKKKKKIIYPSAGEVLTRGNPWRSFTNLAADGQQRVQNHYGCNSSHGDHLGVIVDNRPEGEHQYWAWDQDGDYDQRPVQPLKWNDPKNLQRKRLHMTS